MNEINSKMARGAAWMVFFKLTERSIGLISTVVLARLLLPADFGLVAMAMSMVAVLELLGAFGFDMALIQRQDAQRHHYDTAWTFNVLFSVVSATVLVILAIPAAKFYNEPRLDNIMYFLALSSLLQGFENIGVVAFRKDMTFDKEFRYLLGKKLAAFLVTVPLAFLLRNYWALVIGILTGRSFAVLLSYYVHPYRPRFDLSGRHDLFHFSKWLFISNVFYFLRVRSADFIIVEIWLPRS